LAAGCEGTRCLQFLLEKGEFPNQICNEQDRATPLHFSIISGRKENAEILLKHKANPNSKDTV
jgi:ankyrin repeat protein